jgi:phenylpyruvate tautomerase
MPQLLVITNARFNRKLGLEVSKELSAKVAKAVEKEEAKVTVALIHNPSLVSGGTTEPAALCTWTSIGHVDLSYNTRVSAAVADVLEARLKVPSTRNYVAIRDSRATDMGIAGVTVANRATAKL